MSVYFLVGFFSAAKYGPGTAENVLQNQWLGGGVAQGCLNLFMSIYLCLSLPPVAMPIRYALHHGLALALPESVVNTHDHERALLVILTAAILLSALTVAIIMEGGSGQVITITGATGVCMVSYVIPVVNHVSSVSNIYNYFRLMPNDIFFSFALHAN